MLPGSCSVQHSPSFEQDKVSLTLQFSSPQALKEFLQYTREHLPKE